MECFRCTLRHRIPQVKLLMACVNVRVGTGEGIERTQLRPPPAELLIGLKVKPTNIDACHGHPEETGIEKPTNGVLKIVPCCTIVTSPMCQMCTRSHKTWPPQHKGPFLTYLQLLTPHKTRKSLLVISTTGNKFCAFTQVLYQTRWNYGLTL